MTQTVFVLVDGDNISATHAGAILAIAAEHGDPTVVRVYTDARCPSDWHTTSGFRLMHAGTGKNAADILLSLDALELLHSNDAHCFVIASSDGDFTHIATRLRERGAKVIGVGESKAPQTFRFSCSEFKEIKATRPMSQASEPKATVARVDLKIHAMIAAHSKKGAGMRIAELAPKMHSQHGVRISSYPERSWRAYLIARPALYDLDPRGPDAKVRFRPDGFAQTV